MIEALTPAELAAARAELDRTREQVDSSLVTSDEFWRAYLVERMAALLVDLVNEQAVDLVAAARHCLALRQALTEQSVRALQETTAYGDLPAGWEVTG